MVKLLWGPVLILLRTALQNDPAIPEGLDREAAAAQKSFSQPRNVCKFPRIALVRFSRGLYASAKAETAPTHRLVHLVQIRNDYIEIE